MIAAPRAGAEHVLSVWGRRSWRFGAAAVAVVATLAWAASCGNGNDHPRELDNANNGDVVTAAVGDEIDITLQTVGPGEYGTPQISSPVVRFLQVSEVSPPNPGGPTQLFQFKAASSGEAVISIPHTGSNPTFKLTIDVLR